MQDNRFFFRYNVNHKITTLTIDIRGLYHFTYLVPQSIRGHFGARGGARQRKASEDTKPKAADWFSCSVFNHIHTGGTSEYCSIEI